MAHVEAVCAGTVRPSRFGTLKRSAIDKRPVGGPVRIGALGLDGDAVADHKHHGGPDQAVYAFAREDYGHWEVELGRPFAPGSFGENLTTRGVDVQGARIGERWRVGECLLEVTGVRIPCAVFAGFVDEPRWVRRFTEHGVPGAYLRVIEPGEVRAGDPIVVADVPSGPLTVGYTFRAFTTEPELLPALAGEVRLSVRHRETLARRGLL
ncbi:MAG: MOSC domain-containing protein [Actinobacteria bacterium]|nr:MOSC domain-containing protein [Actinomycetota bacterium]